MSQEEMCLELEDAFAWLEALDEVGYDFFYLNGWSEFVEGLVDWASCTLEGVTPEMCKAYWKVRYGVD